MKSLFLIAILLISYKSQANQCLSIFDKEISTATESDVFFRATSNSVKDIEPDTHGLLIDEKVQVGDSVIIEFITPVVSSRETTTSSAEGYMLGTKTMVDPATNEPTLFYFVMDTSNQKFDVVIAFTENNINYDGSRVYKKSGYQRKTLH